MLWILFVLKLKVQVNSYGQVMSGWSVDLTTLFLGKLEHAVIQYFVCILSLVTGNNPSWSAEGENGRRNYFMIHLYESLDLAGVKYATPGSAVRQVTDCIYVV